MVKSKDIEKMASMLPATSLKLELTSDTFTKYVSCHSLYSVDVRRPGGMLAVLSRQFPTSPSTTALQHFVNENNSNICWYKWMY